jgi:hypothetical protein
LIKRKTPNVVLLGSISFHLWHNCSWQTNLKYENRPRPRWTIRQSIRKAYQEPYSKELLYEFHQELEWWTWTLWNGEQTYDRISVIFIRMGRNWIVVIRIANAVLRGGHMCKGFFGD